MTTLIEAQNLTKNYGNSQGIFDASFSIQQKGIVCLLSPSGSGKSTLCRLISELEQKTSGKLNIPHNTTKTYVAQDYTLWPNKTLFQNLICAPVLKKQLTHQKAAEKAEILLKSFSLETVKDSLPEPSNICLKIPRSMSSELSAKHGLKEEPLLNEFRKLPRTLTNPANYNVLGDIVITQIFDEVPSIIQIRKKAVADTYKRFFDELWDICTPPQPHCE